MNELYDEILEIIRKGTNLITESISDAEDYLMSFVRKLLSEYNNKGNLEFDDSDYKLSKKIKDAINKAIEKSGFLSVSGSFIPLIDEVERLTKKIAQEINKGVNFNKDVVDLTQEKRLAIERITTALSSPQSIKANITSELQQIIYQSIKNGIRYNDALGILEPLIEGDSFQGGLLSRYYKTITQDTLNQWSGTVNQAISNKYGLIDYRYIGEIRTTSRPQCVRWVSQMGGVLVKEVIEAEMEKAIKTVRKPNTQFKGYSVYAVPTAGNFPVVRGGHNCRHGVAPFLATEEEAKENIKKYNSLGNAVKLKYQDLRKD